MNEPALEEVNRLITLLNMALASLKAEDEDSTILILEEALAQIEKLPNKFELGEIND